MIYVATWVVYHSCNCSGKKGTFYQEGNSMQLSGMASVIGLEAMTMQLVPYSYNYYSCVLLSIDDCRAGRIKLK